MAKKSTKKKVRQKKWIELSRDELIDRLRSERRASKMYRELWQQQARENHALAPLQQDQDTWKDLPWLEYEIDPESGVLHFARPLDESVCEQASEVLEAWALDSAWVQVAEGERTNPANYLGQISSRLREWFSFELSGARWTPVDLDNEGEPLFWIHALGTDKALALVMFHEDAPGRLRVFGPMRVSALLHWIQMLDPHRTSLLHEIEQMVAETLGGRFRAPEHLVSFVSTLLGDVWREATHQLEAAQRSARKALTEARASMPEETQES